MFTPRKQVLNSRMSLLKFDCQETNYICLKRFLFIYRLLRGILGVTKINMTHYVLLESAHCISEVRLGNNYI